MVQVVDNRQEGENEMHIGIEIFGKNDCARETQYSKLTVGSCFDGETEAVFIDMYPDRMSDKGQVSLSLDTYDEALTFFKTCIAMFEGIIKERDAFNEKWDKKYKEE